MLAPLAALLLLAAPDPILEEVRADVLFFVGSAGTADAIVADLRRETEAAATRLAAHAPKRSDEIRRALLREVAANLRAKHALVGPKGESFPVSTREIRETVIRYETFKAETFVASGVFPKRYFGYVDRKWDTARYEKRLRELTTEGAKIANRVLSRKKSKLRVTPLEIAATFLAEGGAILLREEQASLESIHPVFGVGLDDVGPGFEDQAALVAALDAELGTKLALVAKRDGGDYNGGTSLSRNFTFDEAVAGTVAMYVFEKEIAERKMRKEEKTELSSLPLDEQFVAGSLVYNSGLLFAKDRRDWIRDFSTGPYLDGVSRNVKQRPPLPVKDPAASLAQFIDTGYPEQPTSWAAVYHVLQRHGAYVGLVRFSGAFDAQGNWK